MTPPPRAAVNSTAHAILQSAEEDWRPHLPVADLVRGHHLVPLLMAAGTVYPVAVVQAAPELMRASSALRLNTYIHGQFLVGVERRRHAAANLASSVQIWLLPNLQLALDPDSEMRWERLCVATLARCTDWCVRLGPRRTRSNIVQSARLAWSNTGARPEAPVTTGTCIGLAVANCATLWLSLSL
jgi:hypothetical protein